MQNVCQSVLIFIWFIIAIFIFFYNSSYFFTHIYHFLYCLTLKIWIKAMNGGSELSEYCSLTVRCTVGGDALTPSWPLRSQSWRRLWRRGAWPPPATKANWRRVSGRRSVPKDRVRFPHLVSSLWASVDSWLQSLNIAVNSRRSRCV